MQINLDELDPRVNVYAPRFFLARAETDCPHCRAPTAVFALVLPVGHWTQNGDPDAAAADGWQAVDGPALVFDIGFLDVAGCGRLEELAPTWRSTPEGGRANHCKRCGATLDDHELCVEMDAAFAPTAAAAAAAVDLLVIDTPVAVGAGGYTLEPQFLAL